MIFYLNADGVMVEPYHFPFVPSDVIVDYLSSDEIEDDALIYYTAGLRFRNPVTMDVEYTPDELIEAFENDEISGCYYEFCYNEDEDIYRLNTYSGNDLF